jgi:DNA-binding response OmpR family regulator
MKSRVLLVEDEAIIAIDIADQLEGAGFEVLGPAASVSKALALIEEEGCDVAVLDFNLRDETAEKVARELHAKGTPFLFLTGVSRDRLPEWCNDVMLLPKPVRISALSETLQQLVSGSQVRGLRSRAP